jgi:hypothetical protein
MYNNEASGVMRPKGRHSTPNLGSTKGTHNLGIHLCSDQRPLSHPVPLPDRCGLRGLDSGPERHAVSQGDTRGTQDPKATRRLTEFIYARCAIAACHDGHQRSRNAPGPRR